MSHTLAEVAEKTGKSSAILRKHIERGKLRASKDGTRVLIEDADLDAYMASDIFEEAAEHASSGGVEVGNIIARLPSRFTAAILDGIGSAKKPASPKAWVDLTAGMPAGDAVYPTAQVDDPHWGFQVGHQHRDNPQWARSNGATWRLDDASYTWNGSAWEGGGTRSGTLEDRISPAHPDAHFRPLGPGKQVR